MIQLRDYQRKAVDAIDAEWQKGVQSTLCVLPTGGGKTAVFLSLLHEKLKGTADRAIIVSHRDELVFQPKEKMISYYPEWDNKIGVVKGEYNEVDQQIIVATVQTLRNKKRMAEVLAYGPIKYLVVDECHHSVAKSYKTVIDGFINNNPGVYHVGVTATPTRSDKEGLISVYESVAYKETIVDGFHKDYLVETTFLAIETRINLSNVRTTAGEFNLGDLSRVFETSNCFDLVVESYQKHAAGRKAAAFVVSVEGAYQLAEKFREAGISAAAADGTTNKEVRADILHKFSTGELQVICNVGLWTEGLDIPSMEVILNVRPTKSDGLYLQIIGRALRTFPGKTGALILDFVPEDARNLVMAGDVLGMIQVKRKKGEPGEVIGGFTYGKNGPEYFEGDPNSLTSRVLNYLDVSPWSWHKDDKGYMSLSLGNAGGIQRVLMVAPQDDGNFVLFGLGRSYTQTDDGQTKYDAWKAQKIMVADWDSVEARAQHSIDNYGDGLLASKSKQWRKMPATTPQVKFAERLKIDPAGKSRGDLAREITHVDALRTLKRSQLEFTW